MTSNAGAANIVTPKKLGFSVGDTHEADYQKMKAGVMDEVKHLFKPEFLNRIDETIVFHPLTKENVTHIIDLMVADINRRLADKQLTVALTPAAKELVIDSAYDPVYGARPLKRLIQREVVDRIADAAVRGKLLDRSHVLIDVDDTAGDYTCRVEAPLDLDAVPVE